MTSCCITLHHLDNVNDCFIVSIDNVLAHVSVCLAHVSLKLSVTLSITLSVLVTTWMIVLHAGSQCWQAMCARTRQRIRFRQLLRLAGAINCQWKEQLTWLQLANDIVHDDVQDASWISFKNLSESTDCFVREWAWLLLLQISHCGCNVEWNADSVKCHCQWKKYPKKLHTISTGWRWNTWNN